MSLVRAMALPTRPYRFVSVLLAGLLLGLHGAPLLHHWCMSQELGAWGMEHAADTMLHNAMAMEASAEAMPDAMPPCHGEEAPDTSPEEDAVMVCCTTALVGVHATPTPRPHAEVQVLQLHPVPAVSPTTSVPVAWTATLPVLLDTGPASAVPLHILHAAFLI